MAEEQDTSSRSSIPQTSIPPTSSSSVPKASQDSLKQAQVPALSGFPASSNADYQMFSVMYPALLPPCSTLQNQEQMNRGAGLYAVPVYPYMGHITGIQTNALIPLTYSTPTNRPTSSSETANEEHGEVGQQQQQHQQPVRQRQEVVRRFEFAFQLDLMLILKLAIVIFLFNQDGSRQRLVVLVFFASLIYLYQTGALTPLKRWLTQGMQRAAAPPRPHRPAVRADVPGPAGPLNENAAVADGVPGALNENQHPEFGNQVGENENLVEAGAPDANNRWWGIVKEIQMIVFGFITSLLPGFHNID